MLYCKPQNKPTETDEKIDYTVQASTQPSHLSTSKKPIISPFVVQLLLHHLSLVFYKSGLRESLSMWLYKFFLGQSGPVFAVYHWETTVCGGSLQRSTDSYHCYLHSPCHCLHPHHRTYHRDEEEEAGCVQEERLRCWIRQWSGPGEVQRTQPGRNDLWFWKQREQSKL